QDLPHGQRVLAAGNRHEHPVVGAHHVELGDRASHLVVHELEEVLLAEVGVVAAHVDDGRTTAGPALHRPKPPEITGRTSISSASSSMASPGTRVPLRITNTVSRWMSRRCRTATKLTGPGNSTSRRGLRSCTFTRPLWPALDHRPSGRR